MKTSTQLGRCCWVRKTNVRATEQSEKFHVRQGDPSIISFVNNHKNLRLKCCKKKRAQQLTEAQSMHALFSVCSLRDDNVITSTPTWKLKHANSILETFEYLYQLSSKSIHKISSYTVSKLGHFWDTVYCKCIHNSTGVNHMASWYARLGTSSHKLCPKYRIKSVTGGIR